MQFPLPKALPPFEDTSILVVGDVMLDRYWFGDTSRISPEAPVPIVHINTIDDRPGGAGNVALNLSVLGAKTTLLGITGNDEAAKKLTAQLSAAAVAPLLFPLDHLSTIIKLRIISRHQQLLRLDFEERLRDYDDQPLLDTFKDRLKTANLVILSDYHKGTLKNPQILIQAAHTEGIPVLVDPKGADFSIYQNATLLTPNLKEFEAVVGICTTEQEIIDKGRALLKRHQIGALLVTRGENGMTLIPQNDKAHHLPAYSREVYDITGAGDTVIAVLGAAIAAHTDLLGATALSNLAASLVVTKFGATSVSPPELQVALTGQTSFVTGIINEEQLLEAVQEVRANGKKIVFTNGCYDIFHAGHATCLQHAKQLGDYLIVAVNDDESIRKQKGANRPVNHLEHRMMVLASLGVVDWVVPFADDTPERLLKRIKPDVLAKGGDYLMSEVVGADIVRSYGGEVRLVNHSSVHLSSSAIIERLQEEQDVL